MAASLAKMIHQPGHRRIGCQHEETLRDQPPCVFAIFWPDAIQQHLLHQDTPVWQFSIGGDHQRRFVIRWLRRTTAIKSLYQTVAPALEDTARAKQFVQPGKTGCRRWHADLPAGNHRLCRWRKAIFHASHRVHRVHGSHLALIEAAGARGDVLQGNRSQWSTAKATNAWRRGLRFAVGAVERRKRWE